ncbi:MAG: transposase [bacterium]|nr:MAG: transposase [bacterium]
MVGQFSDIERKSIEPIAITVVDAQVRPQQRLVSDVIWDSKKIMQKYRRMVNEDLGDPNGVLIFDETGFVKKVMILLVSVNNIVVHWTRLRIARLECLQRTRHHMATLCWMPDYLFLNNGLAMNMQKNE